MNLWQRVQDLQQRVDSIEQQAEQAGTEPYYFNGQYGNLIDELAELQIIIWEAECNA